MFAGVCGKGHCNNNSCRVVLRLMLVALDRGSHWKAVCSFRKTLYCIGTNGCSVVEKPSALQYWMLHRNPSSCHFKISWQHSSQASIHQTSSIRVVVARISFLPPGRTPFPSRVAVCRCSLRMASLRVLARCHQLSNFSDVLSAEVGTLCKCSRYKKGYAQGDVQESGLGEFLKLFGHR